MKAPEPIVQWNGTLDAFKYQNSCYQQSLGFGDPPGQSEDCLYLNIFVPGKVRTQSTLLCPAYTYIEPNSNICSPSKIK